MLSVNKCMLPETVKNPPSSNSKSPDPFKIFMLNLTVPKNKSYSIHFLIFDLKLAFIPSVLRIVGLRNRKF